MANLCDSSHWTDIHSRHSSRRHSICCCEYIGQREWHRRRATVIKRFGNGKISLSRRHFFYQLKMLSTKQKGMRLIWHIPVNDVGAVLAITHMSQITQFANWLLVLIRHSSCLLSPNKCTLLPNSQCYSHSALLCFLFFLTFLLPHIAIPYKKSD